MVAISIGFTMGLFLLSILMILIASVKSVAQGKQDFKKILVMLIPFAVFGIAFAVFGDLAKAGVLSMSIMMLIMILAIAYTGLRGTFK